MDQAVGAWCRTDALTFRLRDPDRRLAGVRLLLEVGVPRDRADFAFDEVEHGWRLNLPRPAAWRLEYLLEQRYDDGRVERICDPDNPRRVDTAFGAKSVLECPEYVEPAWLHLPGAAGSWRELTIPAPAVGTEIGARIWSPATHTDRILVAHDGPEYDRLAALGHYSAAMVGARRVAPHHLVLLDPGDRNEWYSADSSYARALAGDVLPRLQAELHTPRPVVGVGTSLGGLAMLHAQRQYPLAFAGMFLQSGSFFQPRHDRQESGFQRYRRIVRFVDKVIRASGGTTPPVPAVLTCGAVEENLSNNREMAQALRTQGYGATLYEVPDGHNYTAWRDAFDPYLTGLLRQIWGTPSG